MKIEIEKMLYGDYRVQVWDKNYDSALDREYFCRGYESACLTAMEIQNSLMQGLPIYSRDGDNVIKLSQGWEN